MTKIIVICLSLILSLSIALPTAAAEETNHELLDASVELSSQESAVFCEQVANDEAFINLIVTAAQKKEKDISLNGVHPSSCLKLYGIKGSSDPLKSICTAYEQTGRISDQLSEDYAVMVLYCNDQGEYVDSLVFTQKENLPDAQDKNGWVPLGSGSLAADDNILQTYLQNGSLKNYAVGTGIESASEIKLIASIPHMPASLYFERQGEEFFLPLEDGLAEMRSTQVYRAEDVVEGVLRPILTYHQELSEQHSGEMMFGTPLVPDDLPAIEPVELDAFTGNSAAPSKETVPTSALETVTVSWTAIPVAVSAVLVVMGIVFWKKKRKM